MRPRKVGATEARGQGRWGAVCMCARQSDLLHRLLVVERCLVHEHEPVGRRKVGARGAELLPKADYGLTRSRVARVDERVILALQPDGPRVRAMVGGGDAQRGEAETGTRPAATKAAWRVREGRCGEQERNGRNGRNGRDDGIGAVWRAGKRTGWI